MAYQSPITANELAEEAELSSDCLKLPFCKDHAHVLAEFCDLWESIGHHLGLNDAIINGIKEDNSTAEKRRTAMLQLWKERFAHKATYRVLIQALIDSGRAQQALELCHKIKELRPASESDGASVVPRDPLILMTEPVSPADRDLAIEEFTLPDVGITQSMEILETQFIHIQNRFFQSDGAGTGVTLQQLQTCISTLPSGFFETESETPQALRQADTIPNFVCNLNKYCGPLDPDILVRLISMLGDVQTKSMMSMYIRELDSFQRRTKLKDFVGNYKGPTPPEYKKLKIKLGKKWREKTLADVKEMKRQISRRSWLMKKVSEGSVFVTFMIPQGEVLEFDVNLRGYLQSQGVLQISVCRTLILFSCEETDSSNKSTFEYLNLQQSMSSKEKEQLSECKEKYQKLLSATINSLKQNKVPVERILCHLVGMDPAKPVFEHSKGRMVPDLEEADSIDRIMSCVGKYSSFFCFQMLECVVENVGTPEDRESLAEYKKDFKEYAERQVHNILCPLEISEGNEEGHADFYVTLDENYGDYSLYKLHSFVNYLQKVLNIPPSFGLKLYRIEGLKLTFQLHFSLLKFVFPLTKEQEAKIAQIGVKDLWLIYHFSQKMHQETMAASSSQETYYNKEYIEDVEKMPTLPVSEPIKTVSRKDIDFASNADSGRGTTVSEEPQWASRHTDLASVADSGRGPSIFSEDSLSSEKATSMKKKQKGKFNEMVSSKEPNAASALKTDDFSDSGVASELYPIPKGSEFDQNIEQSLREYHKSLHHAAASGDVSKMRHLIEECNCNPAEPGQDGLTPIHIAAQQNQLDSVKYLVEEQKVDPYVHDEEGLTPLHRACEGGSLDVVCYIIDQLKEYMQLQDIISEKTKTKDIPLHFASMNGHLEVVKHFVSELHCDPNIQGSQGRTALHYATESGNIDIIEFLIKEANCDPSHCTGGTKRTPLHIAAKHGWLKIVKYLSQQQSCDPLCQNSDGDTPLNVAAFGGHLEIVDFFISVMKCDPLHTHGAKYKTPMHNAAQGGHLHIIEHLVNVQKCDPSKCFGEEHVTPLHDAARAGKLEIVKFLTQKQKCDPRSKRDDGETPLNEATYGGHLDLVDFFISELKCDPNTPGEKGRIPLHLAVQQGHMRIVKYLVEKQKCDPSYCKGKDKVTPLHVAAFFGRLDMVKYLTLDKRCDPLSQNANGETALNDAVLKGAVDVVKYFISEMKCNPNSKGEKGRVPLHLAAQGGHMELVEYLVEECGCDEQPFDNDHMTPLHLAAMNRHMNIVDYLVHDKNCDPSIQDSYGFTPLHYAVREGHLDVAKYFVEKCKSNLSSKEYRGYTPLKLAEIRRHTHVVHYLKTFTSE